MKDTVWLFITLVLVVVAIMVSWGWVLFSYFCCLISTQGSNIAPFEKHLNANEAENWEIQYNRKLVRDVKTVSKGVMVLTVSAIGTELLFEAEPLDNTVYSKVTVCVIDICFACFFPCLNDAMLVCCYITASCQRIQCKLLSSSSLISSTFNQ